MKLSPSVFTAPVPAKVARGLVLAGNLLHSIGASMLTDQLDDLAGQLDEARATITALNRHPQTYVYDVDEHQGADVDEHQGADVDEHQGADVDELGANVDELGAELDELDAPDWVRP